MRFIEAGGLNAGDLGSLGINVKVPVLDRHSPLSYCIAQHIHWCLALHRGPETCYRTSLQHCYIMQGLPLFTELQTECIRCQKIRKKFVKQLMSPLSDHQLTVAPSHWATQMDLFGPVTLYVPGRERETRQNPVMTYKAWVLVLICPVTKLCNMQVCETSDASGILDGLTRMFCEAGVPKVLLCDDGSAVVKALRDVELDIRNLEHELITEHGTSFRIVPVSGHNMNGLVERAIRTIQDSLEECGLKKTKLHAVGLQTLCKLVENQFNNLPLGFKRSRDADNSELFRILTPNMLRHGRNNARSLEGPVRLPGSLTEMAQKVTDIYQAWFKIWSTVAVPKLAHRTKWFKPERSLEVEDIVYFQKDSSGLNSSWTTGMIDEVVTGDDDLVREVVIRYRNFSENFDRFTPRAARSCVRLHNMDDQNLADDLHELTRRLSLVHDGEELVGLLTGLGNDHSRQDGSDQSEPSLNNLNFTNYISSVTGPNTDDLARTGQSLAQTLPDGNHTTPRARSALTLSTEEEGATALPAQGVQTPVIVCNEPTDHTVQAHGCLASSRARSASPNPGQASNPVVATDLSLTPTSTKHPALAPALHTLPAPKPVGRPLPPHPRSKRAQAQCKQCCCISHHRLADHKLRRGIVPALACDVSDLKLTYVEQEAGKSADEFESLNQMIWSCELNLDKQ